MGLSLLLLLPAVASSIGLPILDAPQPSDIAAGVQQFASQFASAAAVTDIVRVAYITCLLVGVLLYSARLGRRSGKDLILGGVLLILISELIIPAVAGLSI
jgi:hypothetical protein